MEKEERKTWIVTFNMIQRNEKIEDKLLGKVEGTEDEVKQRIYALDPEYGRLKKEGIWEYSKDGSMTLFVEYHDDLRNSYTATPIEEVTELLLPVQESKYTFTTLYRAHTCLSNKPLEAYDDPEGAYNAAYIAAMTEVKNGAEGEFKIEIERPRPTSVANATIKTVKLHDNVAEVVSERRITEIRCRNM